MLIAFLVVAAAAAAVDMAALEMMDSFPGSNVPLFRSV